MASHRLSPLAQRKLSAILVDPRLDSEGILCELRGIRDAEEAPAFSAAVEALLRVRMTDREAEALLRAVLRHREVLRSSLGRDPGIQVAAEDYFSALQELRDDVVPPNATAFREVTGSQSPDPVTGLQRPSSFRDELERELRRGRRHGLAFALLLIDVGGILSLQKSHGRLLCDEMLHEAACALRRTLRDADRAGRFSERHIAIILVETERLGARAAAGRILDAMVRGSSSRSSGEAPELNELPAGIACFPEDGHTLEALQIRAEEALGRAREKGGIRVEAHHAERRVCARSLPPPGLFVEFRPEGGSAGGVGAVINVSRSGVLVEGELDLRLQQRVVVAHIIPGGGDSIAGKCAGRVARIDPPRGRDGGFRFGIAFDGLLSENWAGGAMGESGGTPAEPRGKR